MHDCYLMLKPIRRSFVKYKGDAVRLSTQTPWTVEEVWVGVKRHPERTKCITTFRDSKGNIIERAFDEGNGYLRNRLYSYSENTIGESEVVKSATVKEYKMHKRMLKAYVQMLEDYKEANPPRTILWSPVQLLTNHFSENLYTGEKILSQTKISGMGKPTKEIHTITEFPHIVNNKIQNAKNKILSYVVNSLTDSVEKASIKGEGVCIPKNDSFLPFRALDIDSAKYGFVDRFLKERKLSGLDIDIKPNYTPKEDEETVSAIFYGEDGSIRFNKNYKFPSKSKLAETSRHEVEHVWQWFLHARNTGGNSVWQIDILQKFGKLKTLKMRREAERYTKSIQNYVPVNVDEKLYRKNYIEIKAEKAGAKVKQNYDKQGQIIRKDFPHIPGSLL